MKNKIQNRGLADLLSKTSYVLKSVILLTAFFFSFSSLSAIYNVSVDVDATKIRSMDGVTKLKHSTFLSFQGNRWIPPENNEFYGQGQGEKIYRESRTASLRNNANFDWYAFTEDPARPGQGYVDPSSIISPWATEFDINWYHQEAHWYNPGEGYVMGFDGFGSPNNDLRPFMGTPIAGSDNYVPRTDLGYDQMADLMYQIVKRQEEFVITRDQLPRYVNFNEANAESQLWWSYFSDDAGSTNNNKGWPELLKMYNKIGDTLQANYGSRVQITSPTEWSLNFGRAGYGDSGYVSSTNVSDDYFTNAWGIQKFITDEIGDHPNLGTYNFHFYDSDIYNNGVSSKSNWYDDRANGEASSLGRAIAKIEAISHYQKIKHGTDIPFSFTEGGAFGGYNYGNGITDANFYKTQFQNAATQVGQIMRMMDVAHKIKLYTHFNYFDIDVAPWQNAKNSLYPAYLNGEPSPLVNMYRFWNGVNGSYLKSNSDNYYLLSQSFMSGNKIHVVLHNQYNDTASVNLTATVPSGATVTNVSMRRLYQNAADSNKTTIEETDLGTNLNGISVGILESAHITITLNQDVEPTTVSEEVDYYGELSGGGWDVQRLGTNQSATLNYSVPNTGGTITGAELHLGLYRDGGITSIPTVSLNGNSLSIDVIPGLGFADMDKVFKIDVSAGQLNIPGGSPATQTLVFTSKQTGTILTSAKLVILRDKAAPSTGASLVANYSMDTSTVNSGSPIVLDGSGSHHAIYSSSFTTDSGNRSVSGDVVNGNALRFTGDNGDEDHVDLPTSLVTALDGSAFSLSMWVRTATSDESTIFSIDKANGRDRFALKIDAEGKLNVQVEKGSDIDYTGPVLYQNRWYHIALTTSDVSDEVKLYIDGVEQGTIGYTESRPRLSLAPNNVTIVGDLITLGGDYTEHGAAAFTNAWAGTLDEVKIYTDTLTDVEIANAAVAPGGNHDPVWLVGPYPQVQALTPYVGNLNDGTLVYDLDGDTMTFAQVDGPAWLSISSNGLLSGTPGLGDVGTNVFTVLADDGTAVVQGTFEIFVDPLPEDYNTPPVATPTTIGMWHMDLGETWSVGDYLVEYPLSDWIYQDSNPTPNKHGSVIVNTKTAGDGFAQEAWLIAGSYSNPKFFPSGEDPSLTVEAWVYFDVDAWGEDQAIVWKMNNGGTGGYGLYRSANDTLKFVICDGVQPWGWTVESFDWIPEGEWVHVAGTFDAESSTQKVWVNGVMSGSFEHPSDLVIKDEATPVALTFMNRLQAPYLPMQGMLDEVRISNVAIDFVDIVQPAGHTAPVWTGSPLVKADAPVGSEYLSSINPGSDVTLTDGDPIIHYEIRYARAKIYNPASGWAYNVSSWLTIDSVTGALGGVPPASELDWTVEVLVAVHDDDGATEGMMEIKVIDNQAPTWLVSPLYKADGQANVAYSGSIAADATDPEGSALTFSKTGGPLWLTVDSDGTLSGTPGAGDFGNNNFTVSVTDGYTSVDVSMRINVLSAPNLPPIWNNNPTVKASATVGAGYLGVLNGDAYDPEGATLTFTKIGGDSWLSVATNGVLTGTPGAGDVANPSVFTVMASDGVNSTPVTLHITVEGEADPYEAWKTLHGITDDNGDEDGDGIPNYMEYALGGDPNVPDAEGKSPTLAETATDMNFTFYRGAGATETYRVQSSPDLITWTDRAIDPGSVDSNVTVPVSKSHMVDGKLFIRLRVDRP